MSRSQFNKSKSAVSKALILCILMIISSLANINIIDENQYDDMESKDLLFSTSFPTPQLVSTTGFIPLSAQVEIWDYTTINNTIYMAVKANSGFNFGGVQLPAGNLVIAYNPVNESILQFTTFSATPRVITSNQTHLAVFTSAKPYTGPMQELFLLDFGLNKTSIGHGTACNYPNNDELPVGDAVLTNAGEISLIGSMISSFTIGTVTYSHNCQPQHWYDNIWMLRHNLSNPTNGNLTIICEGGNICSEYQYVSDEQLRRPYIRTDGFGEVLNGIYPDSVNNWYTHHIPYYWKNGSTVDSLRVSDCKTELVSNHNSLYSANIWVQLTSSESSNCQNPNNNGLLEVIYNSTNISVDRVFDPLNKNGNVIGNYNLGLALGIIPVDDGIFVFHNQVVYSTFYDISLNTVGSGISYEFFTIDLDSDDTPDYEDEFPLDPTQIKDSDNDGYGDNTAGFNGDDCPLEFGNSTGVLVGCRDTDGDGFANTIDAFISDSSQNLDSDNDGYGDNLTGFRGDACPNTYGESNRNGTFGCVDYDFDGWADFEDAFPYDSSQWSDWDGDGFGDELIGYEGDSCPSQYGNSTNDRYGCVDDDGDGWSNAGDDFITNPTQYFDVDGDGYGDNQSVGATMSDAFPNDGTQWNDTDGDGYGDNPYGTQGDWFPNDPNRWQDSDQDGYADEDDAFINDATQWNDTDGDGYGDEADGNRADAFPNDPLEWQDSDGDGYGNNADAFPVDGTQWNDTDGDGYGDNPYGTQGDWFPNDPNRWQDSDRDGYADEDDLFPNDISQWNDTDGDGYGDNLNGTNGDVFPDDSTEWKDSDEDGVGNNADQYPYDPTQTVDSDGDGYGDNTNGTRGDAFPQDGTEWSDIDSDGYGDNSDLFPSDGTQWSDTDGDGYGDNINGNRGDVFPQDGTEWSDIDNDGYGDNSDLFLTDGTQWNDTDGDGFGDNLNGANGDSCPLISGNSSIILLGCVDTDGDGYADQIDAFISDALSWSDVDGDSIPDELDAYPNDATQSLDSDGDGFGDNPLGTNADKFPNDATQWNDIDGDGYGDNLDGNNPDLFKTDATQWADSDGDGYGDNPQGRLYDMFPDNPTQWLDGDGDGLGDNQSGTDADPYLDDFDNDGYNDSIDILPKLASPGDLDADGCLDEVDNFTADPTECLDTDGDGVGNNADSDDDGDGWTDADEIRLNADPLSASNQPVDSFEIVVPGTSIGLSAWDLIGIFGGIPLFAWLAFGFATRNSRCGKYEDLLNQATSRDELEQVALRWEYSLMLRMLGPHQGIRLERLRAELDDKFENTEPEEIGVNQTSIVEREAKELPPIEAKSEIQSAPSKDTPATSTDSEGYEWLKTDDGTDWYRAADSGDEWAKFES